VVVEQQGPHRDLDTYVVSSPPPPDRARGLYETLLVVKERPVALGRHLDRLAASARAELGTELPDDLAPGAVAACAGIPLGRLRLDLVTEGEKEEAAATTSWTAKATAIDPDEFFAPWTRGAALRTVAAGGWSGAHKWADRNWLEAQEAAAGEAVPLLVGDDGHVLEAARANVFAVIDEVITTPPADGRILPGTGRTATLELAAELGVEAAVRPLTPADLLASGEVFLTSSVKGIRPARSLDGQELPGHATTDRLAAALKERWLSGY
jgi:para-aminobenzoate synthetase / 4-amino-4-deoxychorismate lyase